MNVLPKHLHVDINIIRKRYLIIKDLKIFFEGTAIVIYSGFYTDFGSVPRVLWGIISPWDRKCIIPYTVHDYLYYKGGVTREFADKFMLDLLKEYGVGWVKRKAIYRGVRIGGMFAWNEHRKKD